MAPILDFRKHGYFIKINNAGKLKYGRENGPKATCKHVLAKVNSAISTNTNRSYGIKSEPKFLLALRFYASGSFLITAGDFCGVSVPSASRAVKEVSEAIAMLSKEYINMELMGKEDTTMDFYNIAKFLRIQSPGGDNAELFRKRKGYFSLNVQAVCNAMLLLTNLVARWPGSSHDSTIFNNSRLKYCLDNGEFKNHYILGDGGYKTTEYMMTPLLNPRNEAERLYNESQIRTRNTIERCFGVLKRRFPVLSTGMRISLNTAISVVVACGVLHNIAILQNNPIPDEVENNQEGTPNTEETVQENGNDVTGRHRQILISEYFATL
ncbi:putative nuclease HARBI1 [Drosophila takahashii]|uniref:putative nuclease HARBI1 n=1 Tax=Drosophila takahashii TaxID=29030 RepID=UPI0038991CCB